VPLTVFHYAFPVHDLDAARHFYGEILGCPMGRMDARWLDFYFFGHQLSAHWVPECQALRISTVAGQEVPIPHFGVVLEGAAWSTLVARIQGFGHPFLVAPHRRFVGLPGEQSTFFLSDPSKNALEFKTFARADGIFATAMGDPHPADAGVPPPLYLASSSPRRADFLRQLGVSFAPLPVTVDEGWDGQEEAKAHVARLAAEKAQAGFLQVCGREPHALVLAADTAVVLAGRILGNPKDGADASAMLRSLSGQIHEVHTAVALAASAPMAVRVSTSQVRFRPLTEPEIAAYGRTGEGRDKAGGYAIQGLAAVFVSHLTGSWSGVVGLPLFETAELLRAAGRPCGAALPLSGGVAQLGPGFGNY
jgi:septum formation protein